MIPIVSVIGEDKEAKTAAVVALVEELTARGYKVGTVKHHFHDDFDIDVPGKATYRHREAGAAEVAIASPTMLAYIRSHSSDPMLADVAAMFSPDVDIIVTEGYAAADTFKIESPLADAKKKAAEIEERFLAVNIGIEEEWKMGTGEDEL
jgi:molybdopterin-guanine dinucleotide biosynthesis protein MobB